MASIVWTIFDLSKARLQTLNSYKTHPNDLKSIMSSVTTNSVFPTRCQISCCIHRIAKFLGSCRMECQWMSMLCPACSSSSERYRNLPISDDCVSGRCCWFWCRDEEFFFHGEIRSRTAVAWTDRSLDPLAGDFVVYARTSDSDLNPHPNARKGMRRSEPFLFVGLKSLLRSIRSRYRSMNYRWNYRRSERYSDVGDEPESMLHVRHRTIHSRRYHRWKSLSELS